MMLAIPGSEVKYSQCKPHFAGALSSRGIKTNFVDKYNLKNKGDPISKIQFRSRRAAN